MLADIDYFNRVDEYSSLTFENVLWSLYKLFPNQDETGRLTECEIFPTIDSIEHAVEKFRDSSRTKFSLVLGDGIVKNRVDPRSGQSYHEATGGSHYTTLHFRKDHNGKIYAFYTDSLDATSPTVPKPIVDKLKTLGIEAGNIYKMRCQSQGINQCGDYSLFNAKAMDQMSLAELITRLIKQTITLPNGSIIDAQSFSSKLRQDLMAEFNGGESQRNSSGNSSQKQSQRDSKQDEFLKLFSELLLKTKSDSGLRKPGGIMSIDSEELLANESIIKSFPDWQRSKEAAYEIQGHQIKWNFYGDGFLNIQYTTLENQTFRILFFNRDTPIEVSLETPQGSLQITDRHRAQVIKNVATMISSLSLNKVKADNLRSDVKLLEDYMSASPINRSLGQSTSESSTPSQETRRQIETLKQYINNAVFLIDSGDGKNSFTIIDNPKCEIKIGLLKSGLKTLIFKDRIDEKKYVAEIHGDQLVFFDLKPSDPRPLPTNRINDPRVIESVLTLICSAVSLTSTSSRTGHAKAIGAGSGGVATSGVARASTQPSQPGLHLGSPVYETARPRSPSLT